VKSSPLNFERSPQFSPTPGVAVLADSQILPEALTPLPIIDHLFDEVPEFAADREANPTKDSSSHIDASAALERMPHLLEQIQGLWKTRALNSFIAGLFLDSRDGDRAGFPVAIARELLLLARINLLVRAEEAAPLLGIPLDDAIELITRGDQLALGHSNSIDDIWSQHVASNSRRVDSRQGNPLINALIAPQAAKTAPRVASSRLAPFLVETPPLPPSVRLDITTPKALRSARGGFEEGGIMDKDMFRCLTKELSALQIGQIVLSSLGDSEQCDWLASGIRFTRMYCKFRKVVLHVDLLSASEQLLRQCIKDGTSHLVIYLNQASGKWRARAQETAAADPHYFRREVRRLIDFRDEYEAHSGQRCELSVATTARRSAHALGTLFDHLSEMPGLVKYQEVTLPPTISALDVQERGRCHCLAPFIEAHVRSNGHLVACAQDHSGYSFTADLTQTNFTDAWLGQAYRMARQRVARGEPAGRLCEICPHQTRT